MHLLHVIHSIDPRSGGPSHSLRGLVQAQASQGHRVTILATTAQSAEPWAPQQDFVHRMREDPAFQQVELLLGRAWGRHRPWSRFSYCPQTVRLLAYRLQSPTTRPDILHVHGAFSHLTIEACHLARRFNVPYVFRPAGSFDTACMARGMALWKRVFLALFHRRDLRQAAFVHVTSQAEAEHLAHWAPHCRPVVLPHGVDLPEAPFAGNVFLERFPQLRGHRVLLYMSRLHEKKRPTWLVESLRRLRGEMPDLALVLAGPDSGMADTLRQAVQAVGLDGQVVFPGFLQGEEKSAAFTAAAVFCLPSHDENFGVAVVEALAHGVPAVVTPGVASHVYVDASGCGLTVEDSVDALAEGIRRVLLSDRDELGRRGRQYVEKHLTWPAIAQKIEAMYREVLCGQDVRHSPGTVAAT